jgi:transposase
MTPPATRELRELVRHRAKMVGLRSQCKAEVHAVLAKCGIQISRTDLFGDRRPGAPRPAPRRRPAARPVPGPRPFAATGDRVGAVRAPLPQG